MSHDPSLVETIKTHFAWKSSAQLRAIVQANDDEQWSTEAIAAARELLLDREAGRAQEPLVVDEEPTPPSSGHAINSVAAVTGLNLLTLPLGFFVIPTNRAYLDDPIARDRPVPFGPGVAWLALATLDAAGVTSALGLRGIREATWVEGIDAAYRSSVFVTPPLADWTLAVGTALFPPDPPVAFIKPLVERLSLQFGDAQYFCTHRDVGLHIWARARGGRLVRGYGWLGDKGLTFWDEGAQTKEERKLGFQFDDARSATNGAPDENCVMQVAFLWSIDPTSLDEQYKEPLMGALGEMVPPESGNDG
jgi:hypothetical protein